MSTCAVNALSDDSYEQWRLWQTECVSQRLEQYHHETICRQQQVNLAWSQWSHSGWGRCSTAVWSCDQSEGHICHLLLSSSSRMRVIYHNWSATKQRPHPQSLAEISHHSVLSGDRIRQCETLSGSRHRHRSVSVSRHFLLQAPQCPCSVRKLLSRDHCCRGRSKRGCRIVGSHTVGHTLCWWATLPYLRSMDKSKD